MRDHEGPDRKPVLFVLPIYAEDYGGAYDLHPSQPAFCPFSIPPPVSPRKCPFGDARYAHLSHKSLSCLVLGDVAVLPDTTTSLLGLALSIPQSLERGLKDLAALPRLHLARNEGMAV